MSNVYECIESLCQEHKITVTELCRRTRISRSSLSDLKHGRISMLSTKSIQRIACYFGISTDTFFVTETPVPNLLNDDIQKLAARCGADSPIVAKAYEIEQIKARVSNLLEAFCSAETYHTDDLDGAETKSETLGMVANILDVFFALDDAGKNKLAERAQELQVLAHNLSKKHPTQERAIRT